MSPGGPRPRGGHVPLLVGLGLYTALMASLLRLPCRVPGWGAAERMPGLCMSEVVPADPSAGSAGGFLTGGPSGDQPALVGMISTVLGRAAAALPALLGTDAGRGVLVDLSVVLLALVWTATVGVVSALSGQHRTDAVVLALAPVVVLVGFSTWDLWAVLFMMLALLLHVRGSPVPAGVLIGLGASVALFPLVVLLAVLFLAVRHRQVRDFLVALVTTVLTWALVNGPFLVTAGDRWAAPLRALADRPVEDSSLWRAWGRSQTGMDPDPAGIGPYVLLAPALGVVAVLVVILLTRREPGVVQVAFLLLAVPVLLGAAYPSGSVLWLAPLVVLCRGSWTEFAAWQLVEALHWATLVLPEQAWPVLPGIGWLGWDTQDVLAAARLLFLVYFVVVVALDVLRGRRATTAGATGPA